MQRGVSRGTGVERAESSLLRSATNCQPDIISRADDHDGIWRKIPLVAGGMGWTAGIRVVSIFLMHQRSRSTCMPVSNFGAHAPEEYTYICMYSVPVSVPEIQGQVVKNLRLATYISK